MPPPLPPPPPLQSRMERVNRIQVRSLASDGIRKRMSMRGITLPEIVPAASPPLDDVLRDLLLAAYTSLVASSSQSARLGFAIEFCQYGGVIALLQCIRLQQSRSLPRDVLDAALGCFAALFELAPSHHVINAHIAVAVPALGDAVSALIMALYVQHSRVALPLPGDSPTSSQPGTPSVMCHHCVFFFVFCCLYFSYGEVRCQIWLGFGGTVAPRFSAFLQCDAVRSSTVPARVPPRRSPIDDFCTLDLPYSHFYVLIHLMIVTTGNPSFMNAAIERGRLQSLVILFYVIGHPDCWSLGASGGPSVLVMASEVCQTLEAACTTDFRSLSPFEWFAVHRALDLISSGGRNAGKCLKALRVFVLDYYFANKMVPFIVFCWVKSLTMCFVHFSTQRGFAQHVHV